MLAQLRTSVFLLFWLTLITGLIYPYLVERVAALAFPWQANGSLIENDGVTVGSRFIGQFFSDPTSFWGRPSATMPYPYNGAQSAGSNSGPSNPVFLATVKERIARLTFASSSSAPWVPVDLVTASGSGLDPEISPKAAFFQIDRIATNCHLSKKTLTLLIEQHIEQRSLGVLGEPRVNVLQLNLALNALCNKKGAVYGFP